MHRLSVNETERDTENPFNWDDFSFGVNKKSKCDEWGPFGVSVENLDL